MPAGVLTAMVKPVAETDNSERESRQRQCNAETSMKTHKLTETKFHGQLVLFCLAKSD